VDRKAPLSYGYVIVAASAIFLLVGWGTYFSYSIFFNPLLDEFGWSRAAISGAFSLGSFVTGVLGIAAGRITDRTGPRAVSIFGAVLLGISFIMLSFINSIWQIYLIYGLLMASAISGLWPALLSTVSRWFMAKRGLMTGIVTSGAGLGSIIFSPLISQFIVAFSWRTTYLIMGIIVLVVMVSCAIFLKRGPSHTDFSSNDRKSIQGASPPGKADFSYSQALRTREFWIVAVINFVFGYIQFSSMVHIVPYATGLGISPVSAASILAVIGAANIFGRLLAGATSDRLHPRRIFVIVLTLLLASAICLELARSLGVLYLFGAILGLAYGGASTLQSLIAIEFFGLSSLGMLLGTFGFSIGIGGSVGPVVTGFLFDVYGRYDFAFLLFIIVAVVALSATIWLHPKEKRQPG
jgi:MFS family permease